MLDRPGEVSDGGTGQEERISVPMDLGLGPGDGGMVAEFEGGAAMSAARAVRGRVPFRQRSVRTHVEPVRRPLACQELLQTGASRLVPGCQFCAASDVKAIVTGLPDQPCELVCSFGWDCCRTVQLLGKSLHLDGRVQWSRAAGHHHDHGPAGAGGHHEQPAAQSSIANRLRSPEKRPLSCIEPKICGLMVRIAAT